MKQTGEKILFQGDWLTLKSLIMENEDGKQFNWETVSRKKHQDVVAVIAKLVPSNQLVLIKQFRPAVNGFVMGFPAGLLDDGDIEAQALKELKEETGYSGKILSTGPSLKSNAATMNINMHIVQVEIDESLPHNQSPLQNLEPEEDIQVFLIHPDQLEKELLAHQQNGTHIGSVLWYFLMGMNL